MRLCDECGCRQPLQSRLDNAGRAYCKKCWDAWEAVGEPDPPFHRKHHSKKLREHWHCARCGSRELLERSQDGPDVAYCKKCWDKWEADEEWDPPFRGKQQSKVEAKALQGASIRVSDTSDGNDDSRWSGWSGWSEWSSTSWWGSEQSSNDSGWSGWRSASGDVPWRSDEQDFPATTSGKSSESRAPETAVTAMQAADHYSFRMASGASCSLEGNISFF